MHRITHDDGSRDGEYEAGRDCRNHLVTCSCGYKYSGTFNEVERRGEIHIEKFHQEYRAWNDPRRSTDMPFHTW